MATKGEKLYQARQTKGYTRADVAKFTGINDKLIYKYEKDIVTNIPLDNLEKLCNFYSINPSYVVGWNDSAPSQGYYTNPKTAKFAQELYDNHRVLFDASRKLKPESLKEVEAFIKYQLAKENNEDID